VVTDFDGTLAPIVEDPATARPFPGTAALLTRLARRFGVVAVVSGRPAGFLVEHLVTAGTAGTAGAVPGAEGVHLIGLYGLESAAAGGGVVVEPAAEPWRAVVAEVAGRLRADAPAGVGVESKDLAVTVHWRRAPAAAGWAADRVAAEAGRSGLVAHPGRRSLELRPPLAIDKGTVLRRIIGSCSAGCYLGDDLGDLPAFTALSDWAATDGRVGVAVAVIDEETAPGVAALADLTVTGPESAVGLLAWLADTPLPPEGPTWP
jgi:trehalose 6-phosphate phosphatase